MKASLSILDLAIVIIFAAASLPLFLILIHYANTSQVRYMDDKTAYTISDSIEYDIYTVGGKLYYLPKSLAPQKLDYGGAIALALVQDDYCPKEGTVVYYSWDANSVFSSPNMASDAKLTVQKGWKAVVNDKWREVLTKSLYKGSSPTYSLYKGKDLNYIWSATSKCWMITYNNGHIINIFEP